MQVRSQRRDAQEHRRRILQTAHRLFKEQGVEEVSMHQIAKGAGVGQGTLYRQYSDKGEICTDLMHESFTSFTAGITSYLEQSAGTPPRERIIRVLGDCLTFMEDKMPFLCTIRHAKGLSDRTGPFESAPYLLMHGSFASLFREERERTGAEDLPDPDYAAHAMIAAISPDLTRYLMLEKGVTREMLEYQVTQLFIEPFFSRPSP